MAEGWTLSIHRTAANRIPRASTPIGPLRSRLLGSSSHQEKSDLGIIFEPAFLDSIAVRRVGAVLAPAVNAPQKCNVKGKRQGTRGTARSRLRARSALEKCSGSSPSAGFRVMRIHFDAGWLLLAATLQMEIKTLVSG